MINVSAETYRQNGIETLFDHCGALRLNERHIEEELGYQRRTSRL